MQTQSCRKKSLRNNFSGEIFFILLISLIMLPGTAVPAHAQDEATLPSLTDVKVLTVAKFKSEDTPSGLNLKTQAGIGDKIIVSVQNLMSLVRVSNCKSDKDKPVNNCTPKPIVLFLEGREIRKLIPVSGAPEREAGTLHFQLKRSKESDEAWSDLLGAPPLDADKFYYRPTVLSVGLEGGYPMDTDVKHGQFDLIRIHPGWFWTCSALVLLVLIALFLLARNTELLRDTGPLPREVRQTRWWTFGQGINTVHRPYSLARFQMAFWFTWVIIAFLYIWLINGAWDTITTSILGLIGIGAGTALGAAVIDSGKSQGNKSELDTLQAEETTLTGEIAALGKQIAPADGNAPDTATLTQLTLEKHTKQNRLNVIQKRTAELGRKAKAVKSKRFIIDVLTDGASGISFHRFQMFVWTLILGVLFVHNVYYRLSMPEFDGTLLALLGISSGTYLGFKIPENTTTAANPAA